MFCKLKLINTPSISLRSFSAATVLALISGCGGGSDGGDGSSKVSTSTFPVSAALKNLVSNGYTASFTVSGTLNGADLTGTGSETSTPGANSSFENQPAIDVGDQISYNLQWKGQAVNWTDTSHNYFNQSSYAVIGTIDPSGNYAVATSFNGWPSAARVGDSGTLGAIVFYSDQAKSSITGGATLNYSIESDAPTTAILAITTVYTDSGNAIVETDVDRYRLTPSGEITWVSKNISSSNGGTTTNFTLTSVSVNPPAFNTLPSSTPTPAP